MESSYVKLFVFCWYLIAILMVLNIVIAILLDSIINML